MKRQKFPRPENWPPHVLHRVADAEDVLTTGEEVMILPVTEGIARWVLYALAAHLHHWQSNPERKSRLSIEEARAFALFLHDLLPEGRRTAVPPPIPSSADKEAA
jgi:hypothetical protein